MDERGAKDRGEYRQAAVKPPTSSRQCDRAEAYPPRVADAVRSISCARQPSINKTHHWTANFPQFGHKNLLNSASALVGTPLGPARGFIRTSNLRPGFGRGFLFCDRHGGTRAAADRGQYRQAAGAVTLDSTPRSGFPISSRMSLRERTRPGLGIIEPCLPSPAKAPPSGPGWNSIKKTIEHCNQFR
jgi:hypothetical protein